MRLALARLSGSLEADAELPSAFEFLEAKLMATVALCVQIVAFVLKKVNGDVIEGSETFVNLLYFRELYKRLKPIQDKLTNHIEDIVRVGASVS